MPLPAVRSDRLAKMADKHRWKWLGQHEDPIALVRCNTKRTRTPNTLTEEFRLLAHGSPEP